MLVLFTLLRLLVAVVTAVDVGRLIPQSGPEALAAKDELDKCRVNLNSVSKEDPGNGGLFGLGSSKKDHRIELIQKRMDKALTMYLGNNACLRYYLKDHVDFGEIGTSTGIMIALNLILENEPDYKVQMLNLNVMDRDMNTMRRKDDLRDKKVDFALEYPIHTHTREGYNEEYIDVCFENFKRDMSWKSQPTVIEALVSLEFGLSSITSNYEKSSDRIGGTNKEFTEANELLGSVVQSMEYSMNTIEAELRNINEDTFSKQGFYFGATIVAYLTACFIEVIWLKRIMRNYHYI